MSLPFHSKCTNKVLHNTYRKMGIQAACQLAPKHNNPFVSWVLPLQAPNCSCPQARACITPLIPLHTSLPGFSLLEMLLLTISFHHTPDILPDLLSFPGYFPQASIPPYLVSHPFNPFIWLLFYYSGR